MPINITDVDEFTDPVTRPAGSDPRTAAVWGEGHQALANRTRYLKNDADRVAQFFSDDTLDAEFVYPASGPRTRAVFHSLDRCVFQTDGAGAPLWRTHTSDLRAIPMSNDARAWCVLRLPHGATLTTVQIQIRADSALRVGDQRWEARVYARSWADWGGDGALANLTALGAGVSDDTGAPGYYVISCGGLNHTVDNEAGEVFVDIKGPVGPSATLDYLLGLRAIFVDPGPRNF